jgi:hypothetical protein
MMSCETVLADEKDILIDRLNAQLKKKDQELEEMCKMSLNIF